MLVGLALSNQSLAQGLYGRMRQGTCWQPEVKGLTLMENSIFNSWRMEDVWLDK
jgi:peptide/nickel transport system substrate-binding protein